MFEENDIVVITVDHPKGVDNTPSKNEIGIVIGLSTHSDEIFYKVAWRNSNLFLFTEEELRYATDQEIRKALLRELKPRKVDVM